MPHTTDTFLPFTLETFNNIVLYSEQLKRIANGESLMKVIVTIMAMFFATWIQEKVTKGIRGSDLGMLNPFGVIEEGIKNKKTVPQIGGELVGNALGSFPGMNMAVPLVYNTMGMGALPATSVLFGDQDFTRYGMGGIFQDTTNTIGRSIQIIMANENAKEFFTDGAWAELIGEVAAGTIQGGSQMKKTGRAGAALQRGYTRTTSGKKKFDVERTPENIVKGLLFGESAFKEADAYYNPVETKIDTKDTEGFKYNKKSRKVTIKDGLESKEVELKGEELQAFEDDRYEEYKRLYSEIIAQERNVKNLYDKKTEPKKYTKANEEFLKRLKELYKQGSITSSQMNLYYKNYTNTSEVKINGSELRLGGVEYAVLAKQNVRKRFSELTKSQQSDIYNKIATMYKKSEIDKERFQSLIQYLKQDEMVTVSEYITGNYAELTDEQKKAVHSKMNSLATEYAKGKLKAD